MLVLSRRRQESIMIGDDIKVTVISFHGGKVRIGVEAPRDMPVNREDIYERKLAEQSEQQEQVN